MTQLFTSRGRVRSPSDLSASKAPNNRHAVGDCSAKLHGTEESRVRVTGKLLLVFAVSVAASVRAQEQVSPAQAFAEIDAICRADAGRLWGRSLCGPILLVDPKTRAVTANQNSADGTLAPSGSVFTGALPTQVNIANTATTWAGTRWTMLRLPLPKDPVARASLMMHEAFHRVQPELGLSAGSPSPAHLATADGRALMRLEWRALAGALEAQTEGARRRAVGDALAFRAARRSLTSDAAGQETELELNEGLAEYTGRKLGGGRDLLKQAVERLRAAEKEASFVRSFAYASGPAYGLLLDSADPAWRTRMRDGADLGAALAAAYRAAPPRDRDAGRARWGGAAILAEERATAAAHARQAAEWRRKLVEGPVLRLPAGRMNMAFNPDTVFPLPPHGTVYPTLRIVDAWGVLEAADGALIETGFGGVRVAGPVHVSPEQLSGPGWTLQLKPGWVIKSSGGPQLTLERSPT